MVSTCSKCGLEKPISEFYKRSDRPKGISSRCKQCRIGSQQSWYDRNKRAILEVKRNHKNKRQLVDYFGDKCLDCGQSFPMCVYDFHHLDPNQKEGSQALSTKRRERIEQEKEHCVLLCANCHRIRHFNSWKAPLEVLVPELEAKPSS